MTQGEGFALVQVVEEIGKFEWTKEADEAF
jgi:hypothetical protein